ncbi:GNAT family N-acetyltransferase [Streptococcus minor]|nr:GNAT family N-acetyltransferase [Streptococcus minor]
MMIWTTLAAYASLETERLFLRPFIATDSEDFYQVVSNPNNLEFIFPVKASKKEAMDLMVEMFMKAPLGKWAIVNKGNQRLIGAISFEKLHEQTKQAELGYFIHSDYWGMGFATEAVQNISFLALYELGLTDISIIAHLENSASQKVAEKAGFTLLRQYRGSDRYTHKMREYKHYHLTKKHLVALERDKKKR